VIFENSVSVIARRISPQRLCLLSSYDKTADR